MDSHIASTERDRAEADELTQEAEALRAARDTLHRGDQSDPIHALEIERLELDNMAKPGGDENWLAQFAFLTSEDGKDYVLRPLRIFRLR